ncbi:glycoside hydrolase family 128 protein [Neolentinus lepideus HHB14362 ss-1]|uniref:Glycoside hydrolase family 128 protein n=1 Tax=Neolentinus lepideus HHB14362 ss-1 TaxID=1314782 RepID=A0A165PDJ8_9AGAM|nr:glycoside hydrolase family 128 protein [Neolentinus lepideus HHB14362 ss-1]
MSRTLLTSLLLLAPLAMADKRGAAWPWYNENTALNPNTLQTSTGQGVNWIYNWETYRPGNSENFNFIGTQRCTDCSSSPIADLASRASSGGWNTVFSLNEPDLNGISPTDAASWYQQHINPLQIQKALPAVSSSTSSGQGLSWLDSFISACSGCYYDYINLHWYGPSFSEFQSYIESAHSRYPNTNLVITEFALTAGSAQDQANFLDQAMSFLNGASYVSLYSYFVATSTALEQSNDSGAVTAAPNSALYNSDGSLTVVGQRYKSGP